MAGLQVGQACGVFHQPGFGSLVKVPRSSSTQPPFATQALICSAGSHTQLGAKLSQPCSLTFISATKT